MMGAERGALGIAESVIELLDEGRYQATYKYALLVALLDLCMECTSRTGIPPQAVTTRQVADKIVELYWPHATPYEGKRVLRQGGGRDSQAKIVGAIVKFRGGHAQDPDVPVFRARHEHPDRFERLVCFVEWKLIEMPIPRLQKLGREENRFLYDYAWNADVKQGEVSAYQREQTGSSFNNQLLLQPGVAEHLVRLNGLLRPLLHREWARKVTSLNNLAEAKLDAFLFGATRVALNPVRAPLSSLQDDRCFYCDGRLKTDAPDVDHFIPWTRYPDNGIHNLVVAHAPCNNHKRAFLAAASHVERWAERSRLQSDELEAIAADAGWAGDFQRSRGVAVSIYSRLPQDAHLWIRGTEFEPLERARILGAFASKAA